MPARKNLLPYLALGIGILSLSFSAILVRWANAPGTVMGFYRMGLATAVLSPVFLVNARRNKLTLRKEMLVFPLLAALMTALDHAVWNTAVLYTRAANATLLGNTAPIWVALVAWLFLRERLRGAFWLGLVFAMGGAALVLGSDFILHPTLGWGDALALSSGMFYAGYFLATQRARRSLDTLTHVWLVNCFASLVLLALSLALQAPITGYSLKTYLAFLTAALIPQVSGYLAMGYALGHLPASTVSPTMIGQPVLTALLSIPILGESLQPFQYLGGLSVLAGIYLIHRARGMEAQSIRDPDLQRQLSNNPE